jgi:hypothetical protein
MSARDREGLKEKDNGDNVVGGDCDDGLGDGDCDDGLGDGDCGGGGTYNENLMTVQCEAGETKAFLSLSNDRHSGTADSSRPLAPFRE